MTETATQLLREREAAERLGVSQRQLELFIEYGLISVRRFGRRCVRIEDQELARFIRQEGK